MSVEPPSSGRPTGPPSGPLSGPSQPPSGPPDPPPGGPSGGATSSGGAPEPHRPWWRSAPRIALLTTALLVAVAVALVLTTRSGGGSGGDSEVFLQAAGKTGPHPFTESTATDASAPPASTAPTTSAPANAVRGVDGGAPGLYGGTRDVTACDVEKQIKALKADPAKTRAFASVPRIDPAEVPAHLRALTPVQLRMDTRVTNHGYRDGAATPYQAVLQSGTAVLVDGHGVPRVRCACGNPLTSPVAQQTTPKRTGDSWPSYHPSDVVVVTPSTTVINTFVLYDPDDDRWFARHRGDTGGKDRPAKPPVTPPKPSASVSSPTAPSTSHSPGPPDSTSPAPPTGSPEPPPSPEPSSAPRTEDGTPSEATDTTSRSGPPSPPSRSAGSSPVL
ncbi:DUF6777 domain-containing protein [Streptomyces bobili]|uniref:DUF6777 domain-containing protein n=1 Tax=Streptomyces bobili TaxID=67280 RepID=UPI0033AA513C